MRKTFSGYYRPTNEEFRDLWSKCLFVLDANVLLNLYRYSEETRRKLLDILGKIRDRLWVPHQAALEYQRNRLDVISEQREAYKRIQQLLDDTKNRLDTQLNNYNRHPLINTKELLESVDTVFREQAQTLQTVRDKHPDLTDKDEVRDTLTDLLEARVGPSYSDDKLKEIFKEGADRFAKFEASWLQGCKI